MNMIAIPVKKMSVDTSIIPLFGRAKIFAMVHLETGKIDYWNNTLGSGQEIADYFYDIGIKAVVLQEISLKPYQKLRNHRIAIHFAGKGYVSLQKAIENFKTGTLFEITEEFIEIYVKKGRFRNQNQCVEKNIMLNFIAK